VNARGGSVTTATLDVPTYDDVVRAAERLAGTASATPILESTLLNERLGGRLMIKAEVLQRTGSFKFRGAYNRIATIPEARRSGGVVSYSSGNHAQGVAAAAALLGLKATIVMPSDTPEIKVSSTRAFGAAVRFYDRYAESRERIAAEIASDLGATIVKPFDDPLVIAGQGTVGLEIVQQLLAWGIEPDAVSAPCSGGGLVAGVALAVAQRFPKARIYSAEPEGFDDLKRSLASGRRESNDPSARSICDALLAPMPGEITFAIHRLFLAGGVSVTDDEALRAMATAFRCFKIAIEPGGAVALAAVLSGKIPIKGKTVVIVASGGNVDADVFKRALDRAPY
jgi:threonine dehydratase